MNETTVSRTFPNLREESFKKIQDLQAVIANNEETIKALRESIEVHKDGLELLNSDKVELIRVQFQSIIERFAQSEENLYKYNIDAKQFVDYMEVENDPHTLQVVETLLRIIAFK